MPEPPANWIDPSGELDEDDISLVGVDGNVFFVIAHVRRALRKSGNDTTVIDAYSHEATSGDYDHALRVSMLYLGGFSDR